MKLFLTSKFTNVHGELKSLLDRNPKDLRLAFIPTAADPYKNKDFVKNDLECLRKMGFHIKIVDLKNKTKSKLAEFLHGADVIFVEGGSTFYLLKEARKSGFLEIVPKLVQNGTVYVGVSAGTYLACPSIEQSNWKHKGSNFVRLRNLNALGLVPYLISVHYKPEYSELIKIGKENSRFKVRILNDNQAFVILGNKTKLVGKDQKEIRV